MKTVERIYDNKKFIQAKGNYKMNKKKEAERDVMRNFSVPLYPSTFKQWTAFRKKIGMTHDDAIKHLMETYDFKQLQGDK